MEQCTDAEIISLCVSGQGDSVWTTFVQRFGVRLTMAARRALRRAGVQIRSVDLDDLLQEVYCRLLAHDRRVLRNCRGRNGREIRSYLGLVAESVVLDYLRAVGAQKRGKDREVEQSRKFELETSRFAADRGPSPEERVLQRERRTFVLSRCYRRSARAAAERDLRVFYLAFFEGLTSREISSYFKGAISPGSVDCVLHRLRKRLAKRGMFLPRR